MADSLSDKIRALDSATQKKQPQAKKATKAKSPKTATAGFVSTIDSVGDAIVSCETFVREQKDEAENDDKLVNACLVTATVALGCFALACLVLIAVALRWAFTL